MSVRILTGPGLTEPPTPVVSLNPHITPRGTLSIAGVEIPAIAAKTDNSDVGERVEGAICVSHG